MKTTSCSLPICLERRAWTLVLLLGVPFALSAEIQPRLHDDRLELTLFAEHPQIVTPIGLAVDARDRVFAIESHTHLPPRDYPGPKTDWIKMFEDTNGDGRADRVTKFADGFIDAMNLAFSPDGVLHVVCARDVWRLPDADGDGVCDGPERLLWVETSNRYSHSCQLGITFSRDGWLYLSRGNNGSAAYTIHGTDGSRLTGWGDGGDIYRCRPDGSQLERIATGFWNAFDLKFDAYGRLLAVDNDPDARGPNRLLHVIEGGDYGYKSVFGGGGNHSFQGWDGELPGTLGYIAGTGEAPSGLIDANRTSFPNDYRDQLLVTIWNENSIARYAPQPRGASLTATHSVWLQGEEDFRPVALDTDSRGNLFITDWVKVDYPSHGQGRIWRVSAKADAVEAAGRLKPRNYFAPPLEAAGQMELADLFATTEDGGFRKLTRALVSDDPFVRHAAVVALARPVFLPRLPRLAYDGDARLRLGALLALRRGGIANAELYVKRFLGDPDEAVRRAALMWVGEAGLTTLRADIDWAIAFTNLSATLFETYLATVETLDPEFVNARRAGPAGPANRLPRRLDPELLRGTARDETRPDRVRALALIHLVDPDDAANLQLLRALADGPARWLQREALRSLSEAAADSAPLFLKLAKDPAQPADVRAEALLALSRVGLATPAELLPLLEDANSVVREEAVRALRWHAHDPEIRSALTTRYDALRETVGAPRLIEQLEYALHPPGTDADRVMARPDSVAGWEQALQSGGDPVAGERVFFSPQTQCAGCHLVHNRGRRIGPELSNLGQSLTRAQIVHAILRPSDQFAPQWQAWFVELKDGELHQGLQLDHKANGGIELFTTEGVTRSFTGPEIAGYGVLPRSLMPDGLEATMTVGELRDLVAFLESLK